MEQKWSGAVRGPAPEAVALPVLAQAARAAARSMDDAVREKPAGSGVRMPVETFARVATMLGTLADAVEQGARRSERYRATLLRVAGLDIRRGRAALDDRAWKQIVAELQEIAEGALAPEGADSTAAAAAGTVRSTEGHGGSRPT